MTAVSKTSAKAYFITGARPTQAQFGDLIDSYIDTSAAGTFGLQMLSCVTSASAQNALGAGTVGKQLFVAVTTAAAQAAIGNSNGSFTPAVEGTVAAGVGTYSVQAGWYNLTNGICWFSATLTWSAHTGSGGMKVTGLPFTSSSDGITQCMVNANNLAVTAGTYPVALIPANSSAVSVLQYPTGGGTNANITFDTAASFNISGAYRIA